MTADYKFIEEKKRKEKMLTDYVQKSIQKKKNFIKGKGKEWCTLKIIFEYLISLLNLRRKK